jgi:hypothetical protein
MLTRDMAQVVLAILGHNSDKEANFCDDGYGVGRGQRVADAGEIPPNISEPARPARRLVLSQNPELTLLFEI